MSQNITIIVKATVINHVIEQIIRKLPESVFYCIHFYVVVFTDFIPKSVVLCKYLHKDVILQ